MIYVVGVDFLREHLVLYVYEEGREEEYLSEIIHNFANAEISVEVEYSEVLKESFDVRDVLIKVGGILVLFILFYVVGEYFYKVYKEKEAAKKRRMQQLSVNQTQVLTPEESAVIEKYIYFECLKRIRQVLDDYRKMDFMRVKSIKVNFGGGEGKHFCVFDIEEEYLYPEVGTTKSGEVYKKVRSERVEGGKEKVVEGGILVRDVEGKRDERKCIEILLNTGFDVLSRGVDGVIEMRWDRFLDGRNKGIRVFEFLSELGRVCGGELRMKEFMISVGEKEGEAGVNVSGNFVLREKK